MTELTALAILLSFPWILVSISAGKEFTGVVRYLSGAALGLWVLGDYLFYTHQLVIGTITIVTGSVTLITALIFSRTRRFA